MYGGYTMYTGCSVKSKCRVQCVWLQWSMVTLVAVVTGNTATLGFGLYVFRGLITLLVLVMVATQPK